MRAIYVTNGTYVDYWLCPECDEEMPVAPGQEEVDCPNCAKQWLLSIDYDFPGDGGGWRNCSTISERKP